MAQVFPGLFSYSTGFFEEFYTEPDPSVASLPQDDRSEGSRFFDRLRMSGVRQNEGGKSLMKIAKGPDSSTGSE